jgi:CPA2 family monovalent cation:H+ antiporter-2
VLGVGLAQVALTALAIGTSLRFLGTVPPGGLVLGLCLALSSTAIVMQVLAEQHRVANHTGRIALSVLLFQDMMVVPILLVVGILAGGGQGGLFEVGKVFAAALAAVVGLMLFGRFAVRPLLSSAMRTGSRDLIMAITLLILVVFAGGTAAAGLSSALGAFLAGLLISDSETRHQIEVDLEPFKGLLLGIFFITVGTTVDLPGIASDAGWIVLAVIALMAVKAAILYGAARAFGVPRAAAAEVALLLAQAGEFAFVVVGAVGTLLPHRFAAGVIAVVGLSMLLTPLLAIAARKLSAHLETGDHAAQAPDGVDLEDHVVIGGFGRVGQTIARALEAENIPYVALDTDGDMVRRLRESGHPIYFGSAARLELLERVGGKRARAFVVTVNSAAAAERMVEAARRMRPEALVFARAVDVPHAVGLAKLGALGVIPETVEASLQLAARVLEGLDFHEDAVSQRVTDLRAAEMQRLGR